MQCSCIIMRCQDPLDICMKTSADLWRENILFRMRNPDDDRGYHLRRVARGRLTRRSECLRAATCICCTCTGAVGAFEMPSTARRIRLPCLRIEAHHTLIELYVSQVSAAPGRDACRKKSVPVATTKTLHAVLLRSCFSHILQKISSIG